MHYIGEEDAGSESQAGSAASWGHSRYSWVPAIGKLGKVATQGSGSLGSGLILSLKSESL